MTCLPFQRLCDCVCICVCVCVCVCNSERKRGRGSWNEKWDMGLMWLNLQIEGNIRNCSWEELGKVGAIANVVFVPIARSYYLIVNENVLTSSMHMIYWYNLLSNYIYLKNLFIERNILRTSGTLTQWIKDWLNL